MFDAEIRNIVKYVSLCVCELVQSLWLINTSVLLQFVVCTLFITFSKQRLSSKRLRIMSETNESEDECSDIEFRKASMASLLSHMSSHKMDNNNKVNGYGTVEISA